MKRVAALCSLPALACCLALLSSAPAWAADLTEVADAVDGQDPFDLEFSATFRQNTKYTLILRERNITGTRTGITPGASINQGEYEYWRTENLLDLRLAVGMYKDLEFHLNLPVVVSRTERYTQAPHWRKKYWAGAYDPNHPLTSGKGDRPSLLDDYITYNTSETFNAGGHIDDISLGFSWSPFNCYRDDTKPTWTLFFDMLIPSAPLHDPRDLGFTTEEPIRATKDPALGEKLLVFTLGTALSKRFQAADPYLGLSVDLPVPVGDSLIERPQFAFTIKMGSEFVLFERLKPESIDPRFKIYFDFNFYATLYTEGDGYPVLTDLMGWRAGDDINNAFPEAWDYTNDGTRPVAYTLPREESYVHIEGKMALKFQVYEYVRLETFGTFGHDFEHFIAVQRTRVLDDWRPDVSEYNRGITEPGKRVKAGSDKNWSWGLGLELSF